MVDYYVPRYSEIRLYIANPDMDDWGQPSPSAPTFDTTTLDSTIEYTNPRDQPPARRTDQRRRDIVLRGLGTVAAGVVATPLAVAIGVPYLAAKGTIEVAKGTVKAYDVASSKLKQMASNQANKGVPRSTQQADFSAGVSTRDFAPQPATAPPTNQARPAASPRSFVHHNLGDDEAYLQRLELMQEESVLISQGKKKRSNSVLVRTAHRVGPLRVQTI